MMRLLLSWVMIFSIPSLSVFASTVSKPLSEQLDQTVEFLMKEGEVPGLSIAIIRDSKIVAHSSYGIRNVETGEKVDEQTIFEAASLSKPVFAYAVMKLVESGKLNLDTPLSRYLPGPYAADEKINLITARTVLSHTTGFPNWRQEGGPLNIFFTPGSRFSYSGEGFVYLQKVVEQKTKKPLNDFLTETVFVPLGMTSSSYVWRDEYAQRKASGHDAAGNSKPLRKPQEANAAASLHTTAVDYAKFVMTILQSRGLKKSSFQEMLKPQIRVPEKCKECIDNSTPEKLSPSIAWGLGWGLQETENGPFFWHWGDNNGEFQSYVSASLEKKEGIVILTNSGNGLSIIPELVSRILEHSQPAFTWINSEPYNSPLKSLYRNISSEGIDALLLFRKGQVNYEKFDESQINRLGYWLLAGKKTSEAVEVFRLNIERFPDSWNAYDSLAEACMLNGDKKASVEYYRKSLELNPGNTNAVQKLKILENTPGSL